MEDIDVMADIWELSDYQKRETGEWYTVDQMKKVAKMTKEKRKGKLKKVKQKALDNYRKSKKE